MVIWVWVPDTHRVSDPTRSGTETIFLPVGDIGTRLEPRRIQDGYPILYYRYDFRL
jgi:hypothetical protein